jgi:hypothetical protein
MFSLSSEDSRIVKRTVCSPLAVRLEGSPEWKGRDFCHVVNVTSDRWTYTFFKKHKLRVEPRCFLITLEANITHVSYIKNM